MAEDEDTARRATAYDVAARRLRVLHTSLAGSREMWANDSEQRCSSARAVAYQSAMQSVHSIINEIEAIAEQGGPADDRPGEHALGDEWPTLATVDRMLRQLERDRETPYWGTGPHTSALCGAEVWLLSLRDHLNVSSAAGG